VRGTTAGETARVPGATRESYAIQRDPVTGRHRQVSRGFRGGKRAAQTELTRLVAEVNEGKHRVAEGTVAHLLARWLGFIENDRSPHTIKRYKTIVRNYILFLRLAAVTGARRGELCALRWSDLDLKVGTVRFHRSVLDTDEIKDTKTHQARRIAMGASTVDLLRRHRQAMDARAAAVGCKLDKGAFLFSSDPAGRKPWHPDSATHWFHQLCARLDLKHVRLHDLRHAHATQLLAAGVDVRTVAGRLGHSTASTTLSVYAHFLPQKDRQAAELMEDLLEATGGGVTS
jgi:integrase